VDFEAGDNLDLKVLLKAEFGTKDEFKKLQKRHIKRQTGGLPLCRCVWSGISPFGATS
jgi:hypothetical protein